MFYAHECVFLAFCLLPFAFSLSVFSPDFFSFLLVFFSIVWKLCSKYFCTDGFAAANRRCLGLSALLACCYRPTLYTVTHLQSANIYHSVQLITSVNYSVISYLLTITSITHLSDRYRTQHDSFYRAMLCIRGTSHGPVSVCLSVSISVSVRSRCSTKTA